MKKSIFLVSSFLAAFAFSACAPYDTDTTSPQVAAENSHNVMGIIKTHPESYRYVDASETILLNTDELFCRREFSGDNVSLFWGLINISDY